MIIFKELKLKNFLSFGETFTSVKLDSAKSTLLVGKNGNGKSTIIESITFALFGKSLRKINKPSLINSKNNKDCLVELEFSINNDLYLIRRGIKPNIFEIIKNGVLLNQDAANKDYQKYLEDSILKISFSTFCNTVVISKQSYNSFFRFSTYERRKFIEEILSLNIFSVMSDINKTNLSKLKTNLENTKNGIKITKTKLDYTVNYIKKIQADSNQKKKELELNNNNKINELELKIEESNKRVSEIETELSNIVFDSSEIGTLNTKVETFNEILIKADIRIKQVEAENEKIKSSDSCSSCGQLISKELQESKLKENETLLSNIIKLKQDAEVKKSLFIDKRSSLLEFIETSKLLESEKNQLFKEINSLRNEIDKLNKEMAIKENTNLREEKENARELMQLYESELELKDKQLSDIENLDFVYEVLKDSGIKSSIIKQYLPVIISTINSYILKFGFNTRIDFDSEFNETFYTNGFNEQNYFNYSAGEMIRIDLALLFAWRYITKLQRNSICNLLILDEILDASLDQPGIDNFLEILSEQENLNLFIVSHNAEKYGSVFERELNIMKTNGFSQIIEK